MIIRRQIWILAAVLLGIFLVSLAYSFYFRIPPAVDARAYDNIAWNLVLGNGYQESLDTSPEKDNSIVRLGPGYEVFLAGIYYLFGHHYEAVWIIQAFLNTLLALLVFLITKELFGAHWNYFIGITAAILIGFSPDLITMQGMLMTETLAIFLITLTAYLFCHYFNTVNKPWLLALFLGLSLGAAALVRTPAAFLFFPIAAYFLVIKNWKHLLLIGVTVVILFSPWIIRNYRVYEVFLPTNAAGGFNLLTGNHPGASGEQGDFSVVDRYPPELNGVQIDKLAAADALKFIFQNPLEFLKLTFYRTSIYFSFARPTGFWFHLSGWSKAITLFSSAIYSVLLFIFGFLGLWQIRSLGGREKSLAKILLAMLVMMPLVVVGIIVETRYRMLVYPFFAVFAGCSLSELLNKRINWKSAFYIILILVLNTGFDVLRNFGRILERISNL